MARCSRNVDTAASPPSQRPYVTRTRRLRRHRGEVQSWLLPDPMHGRLRPTRTVAVFAIRPLDPMATAWDSALLQRLPSTILTRGHLIPHNSPRTGRNAENRSFRTLVSAMTMLWLAGNSTRREVFPPRKRAVWLTIWPTILHADRHTSTFGSLWPIMSAEHTRRDVLMARIPRGRQFRPLRHQHWSQISHSRQRLEPPVLHRPDFTDTSHQKRRREQPGPHTSSLFVTGSALSALIACSQSSC